MLFGAAQLFSLQCPASLRPAEFLCILLTQQQLPASLRRLFPAGGRGGLLQGGGEGERGGCSCRRGQLVMQGCRGNNELAL